MPEPRAQRTLVKSPPEIWAEVSDVSTLARHLGEFGEIRITRLEAETTVVWEGDRARGTVELEASGWGTKVTITAEAVEAEAVEVAEVEEKDAEPVAEIEAPAEEVVEAHADVAAEEEAPAEAEAVEEVVAEEILEKDAAPIEAEAKPEAPAPEPRRGFFARLRRRRRAPEPIVEPVAIEAEIVPTVAEPEPVAEIADAIEITDAIEVTEVPEIAEIAEPILDGEIAASATAATDALDPERVEAVLVGVLDDLGAAHHRPFSRG